ncbi:hypothetical protein PILCRDRAFT_269974 [Piloderma croceum F 1598]|uniref:Uncharacterized protein n=1 Tax=Piloderma croceum (strain F 1598) TaxID=765440 RepID=A0A0C3BNM3_PILCF|nr:hypothetical protein PILCRDRAFT_269974 [Piloderma croceum F 1598]
MFVRYLLLVVAEENVLGLGCVSRSMSEERCLMAKKDDDEEDDDDDEAEIHRHFLRNATKTVIWDIAVGCLALSVKLHRDTLAPLYPVYAVDFLSLAPHAMGHDEFETSQREILEAFSFSLRGHNTPQPIMDEVYLALPSLRALLGFKGGWEDAKREAWKRLLRAVSEPDIIRFPISLLTISALITGIIIALINHYEAEAEAIIWRQQSLHGIQTCACNSAVSCAQRDSLQDAQVQAQRRCVRRAVKAADGVILDLQDLVGVGNENLRECRVWLAGLGH